MFLRNVAMMLIEKLLSYSDDTAKAMKVFCRRPFRIKINFLIEHALYQISPTYFNMLRILGKKRNNHYSGFRKIWQIHRGLRRCSIDVELLIFCFGGLKSAQPQERQGTGSLKPNSCETQRTWGLVLLKHFTGCIYGQL